jgi:ferredoxin--NADP+ reductase
MTHIIVSTCTRQGDCVEVCPVDCIVPGEKDDPDWGKYFYIDPDTCIDCGACIPVCPPEAIFEEDDVPSEYEADIKMNYDFFTEGVGPGYWEYDLEEQRNPVRE